MNLEMAATDADVEFACALQPGRLLPGPERRAELTTEGGLDVRRRRRGAARATARAWRSAGIRVALFIDAEPAQIEAAAAARVPVIELHTGAYADSSGAAQARELRAAAQAARLAAGRGLRCMPVTA